VQSFGQKSKTERSNLLRTLGNSNRFDLKHQTQQYKRGPLHGQMWFAYALIITNISCRSHRNAIRLLSVPRHEWTTAARRCGRSTPQRRRRCGQSAGKEHHRRRSWSPGLRSRSQQLVSSPHSQHFNYSFSHNPDRIGQDVKKGLPLLSSFHKLIITMRKTLVLTK